MITRVMEIAATVGRVARMSRPARTSAPTATPSGPAARGKTTHGDRRHSGTTTSAGTSSTITEGFSAIGEILTRAFDNNGSVAMAPHCLSDSQNGQS